MRRVLLTSFLVIATLWNFAAGAQMLLAAPQMLGLQAQPEALLYLRLLGLLLVTLGASTALMIFDWKRYWPLAWIAGVGRTTAGVLLLLAATGPDRLERATVPGLVDLVFGLTFLAIAAATAGAFRRGRMTATAAE